MSRMNRRQPWEPASEKKYSREREDGKIKVNEFNMMETSEQNRECSEKRLEIFDRHLRYNTSLAEL